MFTFVWPVIVSVDPPNRRARAVGAARGLRLRLLDPPRQQRLVRDHEPLDLRLALVELHEAAVLRSISPPLDPEPA
jgi:hypothetical protein